MKILVVDDMLSMRKVTCHILNSLGYKNVAHAETGQKALKKLNNGTFDFVITDWNMPGMSGLDLLKFIRASPQLSDLPVLMITTESSRSQILDAAKAGVNSYIMKPFSGATLQQKIAFIFDRQ
jgi:two-component system chemotaxis response regulator CheY